MIKDNRGIILSRYKGNPSDFYRQVYSGVAYYLPTNRKARRYLASGTFRTIARANELEIRDDSVC